MKELQKFLENKAYNMRVASVKMTTHAGSGHATTCLSAADIVAALFFYEMNYNPSDFDNPDNDRFILSKGHASPILYAAWQQAGVLTDEDLLGYRQIDSVLEGHPTLRFSHAQAATGSLGIGLSIGAGIALNAKMDKRDYRTYVLMGDSETTEGSVWEAAQISAHYKLDNLTAIIDVNRLGQSTETIIGHDTKKYAEIFESFGWKAFIVDGHNIQQLMKAFDDARAVKNQPSVIIAKTLKGHGIDFVENKNGFHGKAIKKEELKKALQQLEKNFPDAAHYKSKSQWKPKIPAPIKKTYSCKANNIQVLEPQYKKNELIATRKAYGQAIAALGDVCDTVVALDAEVKNSTFADIFEKQHPKRFVQCFIAEQNMVGMGVGFDRLGKIPFISTFAAFMTRAHDQIRMAAIGSASLRLSGSHAGVSIGQDGPSQMALEDLSMMRGLPNSIVLYPSDAVSAYKLVEQMGRYDKGISYIRTTRAATPVLYENDEPFVIGGCKVLKESKQDKVCIVGAGITLHEALKAYEQLVLRDKPIHVAIIDLYSIKPLDIHTLEKIGSKSCNKILTVEDHYIQGGIGEVVANALCNTDIIVESLAVTELPRSGKPEELMAWAKIDASAIMQKVHTMIE